MRYLTAEEIIAIGRRIVDENLNVRDFGLIASAAARPSTEAFGLEPYPTLPEKAAALLHSLTTSHPFTDGNKRVGFAATDVFLKLNGARFNPAAEDDLFTTVIDTATHALDDVPAITNRIQRLMQPTG
ncbi:type II toxin-antitoxin system death-on-curing family toxin [Actinomadura madurae]|uniref:type II toxin-antitoxin system death-on-curing family toxin n=1 Tax=Actinomadura madurae TaxID=1993 RepID=UPI0020D24F58|nr:type II toxin-antitoxin system death-on-curing family toxin [Actinomadura madurae]MCP9953859.1 type II toxin-antitoxin system death-on-curing family toxin [Actinomadura madurae]MCP9970608.1 type II toxin-antitoxin system death-on-curing family toxin [Actinomadura madurae]MCP9983080.1 type II toxin-antitoxin system death-on-curing family toxin [Actinomadura madurae]MCQ0005362.1 type II toxin-antitoxin system death-on-curing family toxin [Actinomadura madurae]MCQ0019326.1 type II toxin-antito